MQTTARPKSWIEDGEKYALVALELKLDETVPLEEMEMGLWVAGDIPFEMPHHWREWLGSIRAEEIAGCNLFLLSKRPSSRPDFVDGEDHLLHRNVWHFHVGLMLASRFAPAHKPVILCGGRYDGEVHVRQQTDLDRLAPCPFRGYPGVTTGEIRRAARLSLNFTDIGEDGVAGGSWRLFRAITIYIRARANPDVAERIHQYCRCVEAAILPAIGKTAQQFKSRTELFIGPKHHRLIEEIYEVRSAVEHLHESRYLEAYDRETRLGLLRQEAVIEHLARYVLGKIIDTPALWPHFANTQGLTRFWEKPKAEREALWGTPIDPLVPLSGFDPRFIADGHLQGV